MKDIQKNKKYWQKLLNKYRFVVITDSSYEERFSIKSSALGVVLLFFVLMLLCFSLFVFLFLYTPLQEYIPGKTSKETKTELIQMKLRSDSLEAILKKNSLYLENIEKIITGDVDFSTEKQNTPEGSIREQVVFERSKEDSLLRISVEAQDNSSIFIKEEKSSDHLVFFSPTEGVVTDVYDLEKKHFGVDVVSKENTRISSVLDGVVVFSSWTNETGYVIGVQHKNNYISVYKHNSLLLKESGDFVLAGEHIAIIGNSGKFSSGPHLHFELWYNGGPVDPEKYISF